MELLKLLNAYEILVQILSFLVLLLLLRAFFWKRLLKMLDDRKERISSDFKKIEDQNAQIDKLRLEFEGKLKSIEASAQAKIQEAIGEGEKIKEEFKKKAQEEAEKIFQGARNDIKYELVKAKEGLKQEMVDMVLDAAGRLLGEKCTEEKDKRIVKEFLEGIDGIK